MKIGVTSYSYDNLLGSGEKTLEEKTVAFPEEGMEALHLLVVDRYPAIIAAAHGRSIYD